MQTTLIGVNAHCLSCEFRPKSCKICGFKAISLDNHKLEDCASVLRKMLGCAVSRGKAAERLAAQRLGEVQSLLLERDLLVVERDMALVDAELEREERVNAINERVETELHLECEEEARKRLEERNENLEMDNDRLKSDNENLIEHSQRMQAQINGLRLNLQILRAERARRRFVPYVVRAREAFAARQMENEPENDQNNDNSNN